MNATLLSQLEPGHSSQTGSDDSMRAFPFAEQMVTISKQEHIQLITDRNYWQAQHTQAKQKMARLEQKILRQAGKIKDLQHPIFGKSSEKASRNRLEKGHSADY
jgi:Txe/YoeB family toxin of Txe-Axe toxin-antitoxin module